MWLYNPEFFELARAAMNQILEMLDPAGSSELHEHLAELDRRKQVEIDRRTQARKQAEIDRGASAMPREVLVASIRERVWTGADGIERRAWQAISLTRRASAGTRQFSRRKDADAWLVTARGQVVAGTFTRGLGLDHRGGRCAAMAGAR